MHFSDFADFAYPVFQIADDNRNVLWTASDMLIPLILSQEKKWMKE